MSTPLQQRAAQFIKRSVPSAVGYVPGSIAERIIAEYAEQGRLDADAELIELLELTAIEAAASVDRFADESARDYLAESAAILSEILDESAQH